MASYVVLARKWRPSQFTDIVGQSHIVRTLMNAVHSDRIHQAYLFTGSRGIGKTSIARIYAKLLRCTDLKKNEDHTVQSCDVCSSCKEISLGNSVDVLEIDGASNNGVDAIREIRENAKFLPSHGSKKIYIIDEVHMLTTAAFNALLKTLEEPPAHVVFIFATTEPHKIPPTILSRCQRFDFRRVTHAQIMDRLEVISKAEGIELEKSASAILAKAAEGSMRDALSLFDQVIAYAGNKVTAQAVRESIGLIEKETLLSILEGVLKKDTNQLLSSIHQAYTQGHDLRVLTESLIEYLHAIILAKVDAPQSTLEFTDEEWSLLQKLSELRPLEELELIFQVFHFGLDSVVRSSQPKAVLEVMAIKCAMAESLVTPQAEQENKKKIENDTFSNAERISRPAPEVDSQTNQHFVKTPPPQAPIPVHTQTTPASPATPSVPRWRPQEEKKVAPKQNIKPEVLHTEPVTQRIEGKRTWEGFVKFIQEKRPFLGSLLEHATDVSTPTPEKNTLELYFDPTQAFKMEQLKARTYKVQLLDLGKHYFGFNILIEFLTKSSTSETLAQKKQKNIKENEQRIRDEIESHPVIREAQSLFSAKLGQIEIIDAKKGQSYVLSN